MANNPVGEQNIRIGIAQGIMATFAVVLRFLARWRSNADFAADDALVAVSVLPQYVMIILGALAVHKGGLGLPSATLSPNQVATFLKYMMSGIITYSLTITMVKVSLLLLYRRIFATPAFRAKVLIVGIICVSWFFISIFMDLFQCQPFNDAFNPEMLFTNHCINLQTYYWGITAANLGIDVIVLFLPLHMVWGLKLPTRQKILLTGIFMLGSVVCIAGAMRIVKIGDIKKEDITVTMAAEYTWCQVEPATAILCACVVTYRPLFANLPSFSKVSSFFSSRGIGSKASRSHDGWKDIEEASGSHLQWPIGEDLRGRDDLRLQQLSVEAAKNSLHIVKVVPL